MWLPAASLQKPALPSRFLPPRFAFSTYSCSTWPAVRRGPFLSRSPGRRDDDSASRPSLAPASILSQFHRHSHHSPAALSIRTPTTESPRAVASYSRWTLSCRARDILSPMLLPPSTTYRALLARKPQAVRSAVDVVADSTTSPLRLAHIRRTITPSAQIVKGELRRTRPRVHVPTLCSPRTTSQPGTEQPPTLPTCCSSPPPVSPDATCEASAFRCMQQAAQRPRGPFTITSSGTA